MTQPLSKREMERYRQLRDRMDREGQSALSDDEMGELAQFAPRYWQRWSSVDSDDGRVILDAVSDHVLMSMDAAGADGEVTEQALNLIDGAYRLVIGWKAPESRFSDPAYLKAEKAVNRAERSTRRKSGYRD